MYENALGIKIGKLQKLKEFNLTSPEVQKKLNERYGNTIPKNEKVISPESMFQSELLETVFEN